MELTDKVIAFAQQDIFGGYFPFKGHYILSGKKKKKAFHIVKQNLH